LKRSNKINKMNTVVLFTCEHASNKIPVKYNQYVTVSEKILNSHRGYDAGAADFAKLFSRNIKSKLFLCKFSRLLIDANRSLTNPSLFSEYTGTLAVEVKKEIISRCYLPYRNQVETYIENQIEKFHVIHISVHTFVPVLNGIERKADIGLLYDPSRTNEKYICSGLSRMIFHHTGFRVRKNYPYRGISDGFTSYLRKKYKTDYIGIEFEINQKHLIDKRVESSFSSALLQGLKKGLLDE